MTVMFWKNFRKIMSGFYFSQKKMSKHWWGSFFSPPTYNQSANAPMRENEGTEKKHERGESESENENRTMKQTLNPFTSPHNYWKRKGKEMEMSVSDFFILESYSFWSRLLGDFWEYVIIETFYGCINLFIGNH